MYAITILHLHHISIPPPSFTSCAPLPLLDQSQSPKSPPASSPSPSISTPPAPSLQNSMASPQSNSTSLTQPSYSSAEKDSEEHVSESPTLIPPLELLTSCTLPFSSSPLALSPPSPSPSSSSPGLLPRLTLTISKHL